MKKNYTTIFLAFSVLAALVAVGAFIFFFKVIEAKNKNAGVALTELSDKMKQKDDSKAREKKISEIESMHSSIDSHFVDTNMINVFVDHLESLGETTHTDVSVTDIQASDTSTHSILMRMSIKGTFANVMQAMSLLETGEYPVHIAQSYVNENLTSAGAPDKGQVQAPGWQADLSFTVLTS